jgi:serine/threonine protein kinase/Tol biopolymer transport system component
MGEVYLARDMRLGRIVAIKVIPETQAGDEAARDRFQREARAASALNHPNICTIYDVGEWNNRPFLAMEYVDGQPLSRILQGLPLPVGELLELFLKLASALSAAHAHGIIHRDIKPSNIVVTSQNEPKIMDFGLAKLFVPPKKAPVNASFVTTWVERRELLTMPGAAMGTVAYMSPEQARGEDLDTRTDLFSLGLVLYEAATGKRAFDGNTAAIIFTELLRENPEPVLKLNPTLPSRLSDIIDKAIEKDRDLRYQNASDLLADLKRLQRELDSGIFAVAPPAANRRLGWLASAGIAASVILAAALGIVVFSSHPRTLLTPHEVTTNSFENTIVRSALSPDGRMIAFGDRLGIHLELISSHERRTLPRPAAFSQNDSWWPVDWFPDDNRLLADSTTETPDGLHFATWVISSLSGSAIKIRDNSIAYDVSPNGSWIAFTTGGPSLSDQIWVMDPQGQNARMVEDTAKARGSLTGLHWSPDNTRIIYRKTLFENGHISIESIRADGSAHAVIASKIRDWGDFCYLNDHSILYSAASDKVSGTGMNLWEMDINEKTGAPSGSPRQLTDWPNFDIENFSLSRDGTRLAFNKVNHQTNVYVLPLHRRDTMERPRRVTLDDSNDNPFFWSPDSKYIYFSSNELGSYRLLRQNLNEDQPEVLLTSPISMNPVRMSPDGSSFLYISHPQGNWDLRVAPITGGPSEFFGIHQPVFNVTCAQAPAKNCVIGTRAGNRFIFSQFQWPDRTVHKLFDLEPDPRQGMNWTLSPNGLNIAILHNHPDSAEIDVYNLQGQSLRQLTIKGFNRFLALDWGSDNRSWLVGAATADGCALIHVFQDGKVRVLANMRGRGMRTYGIPSPDGRHVAFLGWTIARNVYVVDSKNGDWLSATPRLNRFSY